MKKALSKKNIWEKTPLWLKSTLGQGMRLVPPPYLLGKRFRANVRFVRHAQWWSSERTRLYQLAKLREMVQLAYDNTEFYRRVFDAVGFEPGELRSLDNIKKLPTIDKQTILDNLADMCTRSPTARDVDYGSTGGTSGTPLHFYLDANRSAVEYAYLTTSWERVGYTLGMPMAVLRGRVVRPDREGFYHEYDPILRHHYYSSFHMSDENMGRYLQHIATIGPCYLHANGRFGPVQHPWHHCRVRDCVSRAAADGRGSVSLSPLLGLRPFGETGTCRRVRGVGRLPCLAHLRLFRTSRRRRQPRDGAGETRGDCRHRFYQYGYAVYPISHRRLGDVCCRPL